ncbi:MAG: hypothetical protein AB8G26_03080 [Ilumatobacter sp.]
MKVFDTVQALRPEVDPMPVAERRRVRETLFGVGHGDAAQSIRERSASGAVISTAPHGSGRPVRVRPKPRGSLVKMTAGLLVVGGVGAAGWSYVTRDDQGEETVETIDSTAAVTTTTAAPPPSTAPPLVRTGVTTASPLVLPATLLPIDEVAIDPASANDSVAALAAPDGSTVWMAEVDGAESGAFGLEVRRIGAIDVGVDPNRDETTLTSYRPVVPCGFVLVNEGLGQPYDRPETLQLFASMSVDNLGRIDVDLPSGWSVIDVGPTRPIFRATFDVATTAEPGPPETDTANTDDSAAPDTDANPVTLRQIPGGSIAQMAGEGQRLAPTTFLGGAAWLDAGPLDPARTTIYWIDGGTAFSVSSATLDAAGLETFVDGLEPGSIDAWQQRFGTELPVEPTLETDCSPQPSFGSTLDP